MLWCLMPPGTRVMMPKRCAGCIDMARGNPALFTALSVILLWRKKSMTDKSLSRACRVRNLETSLLKNALTIVYFLDSFELGVET